MKSNFELLKGDKLNQTDRASVIQIFESHQKKTCRVVI